MSVEGRESVLAPCPFCGSGPASSEGTTGFSGVEIAGPQLHPRVWCGTCGAAGSFEASESAAIAAWNRRATPPDHALRDALGKLVEEWRRQYHPQPYVEQTEEREARYTQSQECAAELAALLAQASNASGTPTTNEGETP